MSEENELEEELNAKIMGVVEALEEIGEKGLANRLFRKLSLKIEFVDLEDWEQHQICETYPQVDLRTMVYCCSPKNPCPYRNSVLKKIGWSLGDYIELKKEFAKLFEDIFKEQV